jgi:hypothetical protein
MEGFKVTDCSWLFPQRQNNHPNNHSNNSSSSSSTSKANHGGNADFALKTECAGRLIVWFINCYLIPVMRSMFYCTDTAAHYNRIFYMQKRIWALVVDIAMRNLSDFMLERLTDVCSMIHR